MQIFRTSSLATLTLAGSMLATSSYAATLADAAATEELLQYSEEVPTPDSIKEQIEARLAPVPANPLGGLGDIKLNDIVNIAKQLWSVITDNQPVATVSNDYAVALPAGITAASQLSGFSDLQYTTFHLFGENGFGERVYDVAYTVVHQYGGAYQGKGKYLATVSVIPANVDVAWAYKLNFKVTSVSTVNVGTDAAPIASIALQTQLSVKSWFNDHVTTTVYQVRGDTRELHSTQLKP